MDGNKRLYDRTAIITGAGSGLGLAIAVKFAEHGAKIVAVDSEPRHLETLRQQSTDPARWRFVEAHVQDPEASNRVVADTVSEWGGVDVLVTAAAISAPGKLPETESALWDRCFEVNAKGTYLWMRACISIMAERKRGSIITFASQLALAAGGGHGIYVATKGAVIAMTQTVAIDHAEDGIRANVLVPGAIETPGMQMSFARKPDSAAARERSQQRHALKRFGCPEEVAYAALYLASDESSFTTGSQLYVDGGWHIA